MFRANDVRYRESAINTFTDTIYRAAYVASNFPHKSFNFALHTEHPRYVEPLMRAKVTIKIQKISTVETTNKRRINHKANGRLDTGTEGKREQANLD